MRMSFLNNLRKIVIFFPVVFGLVSFAGTVGPLPSPEADRTGSTRETAPDSQAGDLSSQEAELREALRRTPNNAAVLARLGSVLSMQSKVAEAAPYFEKALKINPN